MLNPFKLDDAVRVFEHGEKHGLNEEEMKKAIELFAKVRNYVSSDEEIEKAVRLYADIADNIQLLQLINDLLCHEKDKIYSILIAPKKNMVYITHREPFENIAPEKVGGKTEPVMHSSGRFVLSYITRVPTDALRAIEERNEQV